LTRGPCTAGAGRRTTSGLAESQRCAVGASDGGNGQEIQGIRFRQFRDARVGKATTGSATMPTATTTASSNNCEPIPRTSSTCRTSGAIRSRPRARKAPTAKRYTSNSTSPATRAPPWRRSSIKAVRTIVDRTPTPKGVTTYVTGPSALVSDMHHSGDSTLVKITMVTMLGDLHHAASGVPLGPDGGAAC